MDDPKSPKEQPEDLDAILQRIATLRQELAQAERLAAKLLSLVRKFQSVTGLTYSNEANQDLAIAAALERVFQEGEGDSVEHFS